MVAGRWAMISVVRPLHHLGERGADLVLLRRVDGRGRVVEDQHARVGEDRAGDRQPLALAAREREAVLAEQRVVAVGQLADEVVGAGELARRARSRSCVGVALAAARGEREVLPHRVAEEERLLEHEPDLAAERAEPHVAHVVAVDADAARRRRRRTAGSAAPPCSCRSRSARRARPTRRRRSRGRSRAARRRGRAVIREPTRPRTTPHRVPAGSAAPTRRRRSRGSVTITSCTRAADADARENCATTYDVMRSGNTSWSSSDAERDESPTVSDAVDRVLAADVQHGHERDHRQQVEHRVERGAQTCRARPPRAAPARRDRRAGPSAPARRRNP